MSNPIPAFSFKCLTFQSSILKFEKACFGNNQTSLQFCADVASIAQIIFLETFVFVPLAMLSMFVKTAKNKILVS